MGHLVTRIDRIWVDILGYSYRLLSGICLGCCYCMSVAVILHEGCSSAASALQYYCKASCSEGFDYVSIYFVLELDG